MGCTSARAASCASKTALSRPPERSTAVAIPFFLFLTFYGTLYFDLLPFTFQLLEAMFSVTKRIEFCYGHRLLDYDGICKHPHGHNALAEVEVRTGHLDPRNMVCDFSDIKRIVKGWIDQELDHKMILRHDDPLVRPLTELGEPIYLLDSNPTVE